MLYGFMPFEAKNIPALLTLIYRQHIAFPVPRIGVKISKKT